MVQDEHVPLLRQGDPDDSVTRHKSFLEHFDIVQFCMPVFVVWENQGQIELPIMRIGKCEESVRCSYETVEGSAKAGVQFEHTSGEITMGPGEIETAISVPIKEAALWNATLEFKVRLTNPKGCHLGVFLNEARVKVVDVTPFPNQAWQKPVSQGMQAMESVNSFRLFPHFVWFLGAQDGIGWRTMALISFDFLKNVYHYFTLVLSVYIVDDLFNFEKPCDNCLIPGDRLTTAYVISFLTLTPMILFFWLDHLAARLDITGLSRSYLSRSLFRKFMNYDAHSTYTMPLDRMVDALNVDVEDLVTGYLKLKEMVRLLVQVGMSIVFTVQHNPDSWWAAVIVPTVMVIWGLCRTRTFIDASVEVGDKRLACVSFVSETLQKLDLVASYKQRPQMNEFFAHRDERLRTVKVFETHVILTNMFIPKLLGPMLVAIYTVVGAHLVIKGDLKLGVFLATINVMGSICGAFSDCFCLVMEVIGTLPALKDLFILLNMPTDVPDLGRSNDSRMQMTRERRREMVNDESVPKADRLKIELVDLCFAHGEGTAVLQKLNLQCSQGFMCQVKAKSGAGRQTLMQILAMLKFPTSGTLFVPSHLRIIYVPQEIVLLNLPIWDNLTFGNREGVNPYRVEKILRYFDMVEAETMCKSDIERRKKVHDRRGTGDSHDEDAPPGDTSLESEETTTTTALKSLRESDQLLIHLVRAFITNPEVMVLHRPFMRVRKGKPRDRLTEALKEHQSNRGLCVPPATVFWRRPRTVFFSSDTATSKIADWVWELPDELHGQCKQHAPSKEPSPVQEITPSVHDRLVGQTSHDSIGAEYSMENESIGNDGLKNELTKTMQANAIANGKLQLMVDDARQITDRWNSSLASNLASKSAVIGPAPPVTPAPNVYNAVQTGIWHWDI